MERGDSIYKTNTTHTHTPIPGCNTLLIQSSLIIINVSIKIIVA